MNHQWNCFIGCYITTVDSVPVMSQFHEMLFILKQRTLNVIWDGLTVFFKSRFQVCKSILYKMDMSGSEWLQWKEKNESLYSSVLVPRGFLPLHVSDVSLPKHTWFKWSASHQALLKLCREPFIWDRCAEAGRLKDQHEEHCPAKYPEVMLKFR